MENKLTTQLTPSEFLTAVRFLNRIDEQAMWGLFQARYAHIAKTCPTMTEMWQWVNENEHPSIAEAVSRYGDLDDEFYDALSDLTIENS